jgi:nicotinate-nucleotide adenylyltransferase
MARRIGILGGTFDPIHHGHIDVGSAAHAALELDRLIVVASNIPPHRPQPFASPYHRFAMTAMAVADHQGWTVDDLELQLGAPSYTSGTLEQFHGRGYAPSELFFVIGADAFAEIASWHDYPAILGKANFAVVSRPGHPVGALAQRLPALASQLVSVGARHVPGTCLAPLIFLIDAPTADGSSSAIRSRIAANESIAGMVPPAVQQHIEQHGLYASTPRPHDAERTMTPPSAGRLHGKD